MLKTNSNNYHLKGLTELRAIAALLVIISHIDQFHYIYNVKEIGLSKTDIAGHAVTFFFVLSGFLITNLLLKEIKVEGKVHITNFYVRRILRTWPLYYLCIILAIIIYFYCAEQEGVNFKHSIRLYLIMAPNVALVSGVALKAIAPLWSIGVEEQFYLIWPWVVKIKCRYWMLFLVILSYIFLKIIVYSFNPNGGEYALLILTRIDCMAIGGVTSVVYLSDWDKWRKIIFNKTTESISIIVVLLPLSTYFEFYADLQHELFALASSVIIINISLNNNSIIKLNSRLLHYLGERSYGLYVFHMFVITLVGPQLAGLPTVLIYSLIIGITIILSGISYSLVETKFLSLKKKFALIKSSI